jgi:hypothetical protein
MYEQLKERTCVPGARMEIRPITVPSPWQNFTRVKSKQPG